MIEKITGLWLLFCFGNLLADVGVVLFAVILYKIRKASSKYSNELIEYSADMARWAAAAVESLKEPAPEPLETELFPTAPGEIEPWTPPLAPSRPVEIRLWEGRQIYTLILFGVGISIQIIALIFSIC